MGQPNLAQREPSMEEILASIRRIIEDSETTRKPEDDDSEVDLRRLREEAANSSVPQARAATRLEPAAPSIARATSDERKEPTSREDSFGHDRGFEQTEFEKGEPEIEREESELERQAAQAAERVRARSAAIAATQEPEDEDDSDEAEQSSPEAGTQSGTIVSVDTGRQVAAAFSELSAAFEASRTRNIDDLTQEMLRPMLQDWLDNNLPTLVERLVREEIERVARGSR